MPIDKNLISKKLDFLDRHLSSIEKMEFTQSDFVEDSDVHDLVTFRLQQSVETCIDIANHLINALGLDRKETAKDAFLLLGEKGLISKTLSLKMGQATDFRNRVVHGYNNFDYRLLFKDFRDDINDLRAFGKSIVNLLEKKIR